MEEALLMQRIILDILAMFLISFAYFYLLDWVFYSMYGFSCVSFLIISVAQHGYHIAAKHGSKSPYVILYDPVPVPHVGLELCKASFW
jgi:hypothetical protein